MYGQERHSEDFKFYYSEAGEEKWEELPKDFKEINLRQDTFEADFFYSVNLVGTPRGSYVAVYDGIRELFIVSRYLTMEEHIEKVLNNDNYEYCGIFTTAKGNQFFYTRDCETNENFLVRLD